MRIICLTNFYPPYEIGGEEQSCYDTVQALQQCGHQVTVLTSTHGVGQIQIADNVYRLLHLEMEIDSPLHPWRFFFQRRQREQQTLANFEQVTRDFQPDVVFIWGMWNLPRSLPALAEEMYPNQVLYRFGDYWPSLPSQHQMYWQTPGRSTLNQLIKKLFSRFALRQLAKEPAQPQLKLKHSYCISAGVRQEMLRKGVHTVAQARIIHNGLDTNEFRSLDHSNADPNILRLVYAGRLVADKGVHTIIEAMNILIHQRHISNFSLDIVGQGSSEYRAKLEALTAELGLTEYIHFRGVVPKDMMPALLNEFDALLFPSIWPEPFGRSIIEAMACELAVICTPVGGIPEIIEHDQNGLFFEPENPDALAKQIERLINDSQLLLRLQQAGRQTVEERFSISRTLDQIEKYLGEISKSSNLCKTQ